MELTVVDELEIKHIVAISKRVNFIELYEKEIEIFDLENDVKREVSNVDIIIVNELKLNSVELDEVKSVS